MYLDSNQREEDFGFLLSSHIPVWDERMLIDTPSRQTMITRSEHLAGQLRHQVEHSRPTSQYLVSTSDHGSADAHLLRQQAAAQVVIGFLPPRWKT